MPALVQTISPFRIGLGISIGLLVIVLDKFGHYQPSPPVTVALILLSLVIAAQGLQPFGDTIAYHLLQAATFAVWGLTVIFAEELNVIAVVFTVIGFLGMVNYGQKAMQDGMWSSVNG